MTDRSSAAPAVVLVSVAALAFAFPGAVSAGEISIAVASNFYAAMKKIAADFEEVSGHTVSISSGSTGKLYSQIVNGAPFDIFFAADSERPARLEREGYAIAGSRFTYAVGRLAVFSSKDGQAGDLKNLVTKGDFRKAAIANPRVAPYGRAARQALIKWGVWKNIKPRLVFGENVSQTLHFILSGSADIGLVALSHTKSGPAAEGGSVWIVPGSEHDPIEQQAVTIKNGAAAASELAAYVRNGGAAAIMKEFGYIAPE